LINSRVMHIVAVICVCVMPPGFSADAADKVSTKSNDADVNGRAPVRITKVPNVSYKFQGTFSPGKEQVSGELISVDSKSLRGMSEDAIIRSMNGSIGSFVDIDYLDSESKLCHVKFKREPAKKGGLDAKKDLKFSIECLDSERIAQINSQRGAADDYESQNLDLFAQGYSRMLVDSALELPGPKSSAIGRESAEAVILHDRIGNLKAADQYLKTVFDNASFDLSFRNLQQNDSEKLIKHLIATGRTSEAVTLCKKIIEALERHKKTNPNDLAFDSARRQITLELQARALIAAGRTEDAFAIVAKLVDEDTGMSQWQLRGDRPQEWLADLLEQVGNYKLAAKCYEQWLHVHDTKGRGEHPGTHVVRDYCFDACRLAELRVKLGEVEQAIEILQAALLRYNSLLRTEEQVTVEKLAAFYPTGSDMETQIARYYLVRKDFDLAQEHALKAITRIESAIGPNTAVLKAPLEISALALQQKGQSGAASDLRKRISALPLVATYQTPVDDKQFAMLRTAISNIDARNVPEIRKSIDAISKIYEQQEPVHDFHRTTLNIFCAQLAIARALSDHDLFVESDRVLDRLDRLARQKEFTPIAYSFIAVEKSLNQARQRGNKKISFPIVSDSKELLSQLWPDSVVPANLSADLTEAENFRVLACIYSYAGELSRATLLINEALSASERARSIALKYGHRSSAALARQDVIILLDAARIRAQARQRIEALKLGNRAVSLCAATPPDKTNSGRTFNNEYRFKLFEFAKILHRNGESIAVLEQFMKNARIQMDRGATADVPIDHQQLSRYYGGFYALLDAYLAQILFIDKQFKEALPYVKKALEESGNNATFQLQILAGNIMESNGLYAEAAHCYVMASDHGADFGGQYNNAISELGLENAAACADKAKSMNSNEAANIYLRLALRFENEDSKRTKALDLMNKAYALISDSEPGKVTLNARIASLRRTIEQAQNSVTATSAPAPTAPSKAPTPEEIRKQRITSALSEIEPAKEKAIQRERNHLPAASESYLALGLLEVQAGLNDSGIKDFRHGLSLYSEPADMFSSYHIEGLIRPLQIAKALAASGNPAVGESLIFEAQKVVDAAFGKDSVATMAVLSDLTLFYLDQKREADAIRALDELLQLNLRNAELDQTNSLQAIIRYTDSLIKRDKGELALVILRKILASQKQQFDPDDGRIASTLVEIAKVQNALGQYKEAESSMLDAAVIFKLYVGVPGLTTPCYELIEIWKNMGKTSDAKLVRVGYLQASPALLRRFGQAQFADKIEKDGKLPDDFVDAQHPYEHNRVVYERTATRSQKIEALQAEYQAACIETPYSPRAIGALTELMRLAKAEQNWKLLLDVSAARVKQYEHSPDTSAGRSFGVPPDIVRIEYYSNAALACIHLDKLDEAQKWLERAVKNMPLIRCYEYSRIATLMLDCDNKTAAEKYAMLSEPGFNERYNGLSPWELEKVWKKLGHPERAAALEERQKELKAKSDEQMKNAQTSPFKYLPYGGSVANQ
jgi:tetratricopeptide (TPR) repeat protein